MMFPCLVVITFLSFVSISFISKIVDKATIIDGNTNKMIIDWTTRVDVVPSNNARRRTTTELNLTNTVDTLQERILMLEKDLKRKTRDLSDAIETVKRQQQQQQEREREQRRTRTTPPTSSPTTVPTKRPTSMPTSPPVEEMKQHHQFDTLPTCQDIMNTRPEFRDGAFLTRPTTEVVWKPRVDGSRELTLPHACHLKRYTSQEARQCLAGHHMVFVGDSLSRYQYLALVHFIENNHHPPRFGKMDNCTHINEDGIPQCSKPGTRNICFEGEYKSWQDLYMDIGGDEDGGVFNGRAQCACARLDKNNSTEDDFTQSMHYVSEEIIHNKTTTTKDGNNNNNNNNNSSSKRRVKMTLIGEVGWDRQPSPINMWNFSNCSYDGSCRHSREYNNNLISRAYNKTWDWSLPLKDALNSTLPQYFSDVDITIYNRGLWNEMTTNMATELMPLFYEWTGGSQGRCFYKSSTGSTRVRSIKRFLRSNLERDRVFEETIRAGCGYFDVGHVTREFMEFVAEHPFDYKTNGGMKRYGNWDEFSTIFWDAVHYAPWVYEELNNLLLNVLCNVQ